MTSQEQDMVELLPCPFCGGRAHLTEHAGHEHSDALVRLTGLPKVAAPSWTIECQSCPCGFIEDDRARVVVAWNRRNLNAADVSRNPLHLPIQRRGVMDYRLVLNWSLIETAPRDQQILMGHWWPDERRWLWVASGTIYGVDGAYWCDFDDDCFRPENFHAATHWNVMLPPPEPSGPEEET